MELHIPRVEPMGFAVGAMPAGSESFLEAVQLAHVPAEEVASVLDLRKEIDLSVHAAAGPQFERLEKKETSAALWSRSIFTASASARFVSCRWATA
jgi:hypothetical protein